MGTFIYHGSSIFWRNVKDYASLHGNEVVCWKFLVILYRILQDGQASAIKDSLAEIPFIGMVLHGQTLADRTSLGPSFQHTMHLLPSVATRPYLELKTRPKQFLGSLPLVIALPGLSHLCVCPFPTLPPDFVDSLMSISPLFYEQLVHTKVFCAAVLTIWVCNFLVKGFWQKSCS
jgi:hypothetical protein